MIEFLSVTLFILLAAMAPGADFAVVMRNALVYSRHAACMTALGIGASMLVHTSYSLLGLAVIIAQSALLFTAVKVAGAAYLCWLGLQSLLGRGKALPRAGVGPRAAISDGRAVAQGFLCNLLNPKAPLFFIAFYSVVVPSSAPLTVRALYGLECALVVGGWFVLLALVATHEPVERWLGRAQLWLSRAFGGVLIYFGVRLVFI